MAFGNKEHKTKKIACLRPTIKHASASKKKKKIEWSSRMKKKIQMPTKIQLLSYLGDSVRHNKIMAFRVWLHVQFIVWRGSLILSTEQGLSSKRLENQLLSETLRSL